MFHIFRYAADHTVEISFGACVHYVGNSSKASAMFLFFFHTYTRGVEVCTCTRIIYSCIIVWPRTRIVCICIVYVACTVLTWLQKRGDSHECNDLCGAELTVHSYNCCNLLFSMIKSFSWLKYSIFLMFIIVTLRQMYIHSEEISDLPMSMTVFPMSALGARMNCYWASRSNLVVQLGKHSDNHTVDQVTLKRNFS